MPLRGIIVLTPAITTARTLIQEHPLKEPLRGSITASSWITARALITAAAVLQSPEGA